MKRNAWLLLSAVLLLLACLLCGCNRDRNDTMEHPNNAHEFVVWQIIQEPTCTEDGVQEGLCACGEKERQEIAALGHNEISHPAQAPTCTEIGWDTYVTCSRCEYSTYEEKQALKHDETSHLAQTPTCTEIGWEAYVTCSRCEYSTYMEIPATHDSSYADPNCAECLEIIGDGLKLRFTPNDGAYMVTDIGTCTVRALVIPSVYRGKPVTSIGYSAFDGCTSLKRITIPDSVTSIECFAFSDCESLTSITLSDSVTSIDNGTFWGCTSLTSITIPDSVTEIGDYTFFYCWSLSVVYYTGTVEEWNQISIRSNNSHLTSATRYYYSETEPTETGNYWHYDEQGNPVAW